MKVNTGASIKVQIPTYASNRNNIQMQKKVIVQQIHFYSKLMRYTSVRV